MTPEVHAAIEEIRSAFPDNDPEFEEEGQGGAYVIVHNLPLGERYSLATTWLGFLIPFQYPNADVYPHYMDGNLKRRDGNSLGESFSNVTWRGRSAIQISRRSNRWNPAQDNAALKLVKVLQWIQTR